MNTNDKNSPDTEEKELPSNFIHDIIKQDISDGKTPNIVTRFPPEPNGYLHIGHAKAISIAFETALLFNGKCHLRFDDTNPSKEESEYIDSIQEDVKWLGYNWGDNLFYASDYFEKMFNWAIELIKIGKAYVDDLNAEEIREYRGTLKKAGKNSPYRDRSVEENLELFEKMAKGEFEEGTKILRAKVDMASPNMNMRDPAMYRIQKAHHVRQGDSWCVYPMYDWAHGLEDSIEGISHSTCSLEFEDHRPLYYWFLEQLSLFKPRQVEFARLNITYTVMSKRKLLELVNGNYVSGWDDPRMPTLSGFRRKGYPAKVIRDFCARIGVAKHNSLVDFALLESILKESLNKSAKRVMAVLRPLKIVIENYPEDTIEELECINNPENPDDGTRKVPFSKVIYIEQDDFMENPPRKFFRLGVGREVRLRYAYFITCNKVIKDETTGEILELSCTYDPATKGGSSPDGRKVRGTLHWVAEQKALRSKVNLYDHLFSVEQPEKEIDGKTWLDNLNPKSLEVLTDCYMEPSLAELKPGERVQFERLGYFCADSKESTVGKPVFNRISTLRDSWAKFVKKGK